MEVGNAVARLVCDKNIQNVVQLESFEISSQPVQLLWFADRKFVFRILKFFFIRDFLSDFLICT